MGSLPEAFCTCHSFNQSSAHAAGQRPPRAERIRKQMGPDLCPPRVRGLEDSLRQAGGKPQALLRVRGGGLRKGVSDTSSSKTCGHPRNSARPRRPLGNEYMLGH